MDYRLLGAMEVWSDGGSLTLGGAKQRAVLAVLLLNANMVVEFDRVIDAVWDGNPPAKAMSSLRAYIANLRRILDRAKPGAHRLVTHSYGYRLDLGSDRIDIEEFEALARTGRDALAASNAVAAEQAANAALDLWRGTPLADFRSQDFAFTEAQRLESIRCDVVETKFEACLLLGRTTDLVSDIEAEIRGTPLRERLWAQLMLALYRSGRRADALVAYDRAERLLDDELGVPPGDALRQLADDVRVQALELDWVPPRPTLVVPPAREDAFAIFGRSGEVEQVAPILANALAGQGQTVVLTGDSGAGKSAVAAAITAEADRLGLATAWSSHTDSVRKPVLWAWTQVLRRLGDSIGADRLARVNDAAPGVISTLVPEWHSPPTDASGTPEPNFELIEGTALAVRELAVARPSLIVLDDLHLADKATHDVLALLSGWIHQLPLVVIVTWPDGGTDRPARPKAFDRLLSRSDITMIKIRGLDHLAVAELIEHVAGVAPTPEFVSRIRHRTGGNPFYVRELVRLLRSDEHLDSDTREIAVDEVPDAVAGVIRRRMAGLPKPTRAALSVAAIIGAEFGSTILAQVLGVDSALALTRLEPAVRAGLVTEVSNRPNRFSFSHSVVRDAIAALITGPARTAVHADMARACLRNVASGSAEYAIAAAVHGWRAGDRLDPESALLLFDRALAVSTARSAYGDIADLDTKALEIAARLPVGPKRAERETQLWLQLASVLAVVRGQNDPEVVTALQRAFDVGTANTTSGQFSSAVTLRCLMMVGAGQYREAAALATGLIAQFESSGDPTAGAGGYYIRALARFMNGDLGAALESVDRLFSDVPTPDPGTDSLLTFDVRAHGIAAWAYAMSGDVDRGRAFAHNGIDVAVGRGDSFGAAVVRTALVQLDAMTGTVEGTVERADGICAELAGMGMDQIAASVSIVGDWARAMGPNGVDTAAAIRRSLEVHSAGGTRIWTPLYLALLSDVEAAHGAVDSARTTLHRAELMATAQGERVWEKQLSARRRCLRAESRRAGAAS
ncbi:BTAD domain-containing putative transcriptional regulator [Antrihabitans cavernicola]|uniref:BTAD domain-containing putative transcriptional regulator n=1 Tax=Antrihabitans cavernicola TaxID=2495913 RepID=UPI001659E0EE|nr:BTAD domain-containing putative transcriptional regulator [Spelaeibacter cavernicola]